MRRMEMLQEIRKMRFEEMYLGWQEGRLSQEEAAQGLGVCSRTFRRQFCRAGEIYFIAYRCCHVKPVPDGGKEKQL